MKPISCIFLALCAAVSPLSVHAAPGLAPVKKTADVKKEKTTKAGKRTFRKSRKIGKCVFCTLLFESSRKGGQVRNRGKYKAGVLYFKHFLEVRKMVGSRRFFLTSRRFCVS